MDQSELSRWIAAEMAGNHPQRLGKTKRVLIMPRLLAWHIRAALGRPLPMPLDITVPE